VVVPPQRQPLQSVSYIVSGLKKTLITDSHDLATFAQGLICLDLIPNPDE